MITRICKQCGKEFKTYKCKIDLDKGKFCSKRCVYDFRITSVVKKCLVCGKEFRVLPCKIKQGGGKFCSRKCYKIFTVGSNSPSWTGGRRKQVGGYIVVYCPNHPNAHLNCVLEHRLVMEKHLGRRLESNEIVHHINENREDNRIKNLIVVNHKEHAKIHNLLRWKKHHLKQNLVL